MKRIAYFLPLLLIILSACTSTDGSTPAIESVSEEEMAIDQAVLNAYAVLSFEEGSTPDYDAMASLFTSNATMYNFRYDSLAAFDITLFIQSYKSAIDRGAISSFSEVELGGKTEYFGNVAHRMSAYASYFNGSDEIGERGVNSFQLLKVDGEWIINSVIWDVEKEGQPIPPRYLGAE
ncbi:MAG: hypothetical protein AAF564_11515 [Bacteroidota bacterium]